MVDLATEPGKILGAVRAKNRYEFSAASLQERKVEKYRAWGWQVAEDRWPSYSPSLHTIPDLLICRLTLSIASSSTRYCKRYRSVD